MIWKSRPSPQEINDHCKNTLVEHLGIEITELASNELSGVMPVGDHLKQPFGIVHGGANCVLAETLGSLAANLVLDQNKEHAVGLTISTNHIKAVRNGVITGKAKAIHLGRKTHVWIIDTFNSKGELTSTTNLTMAIISKL